MAITGIAQDVAQSKIPPKGTCCVCTALATLPDDQAEALRDLLRNPKVRYTELSEWLAVDEDHPLDLPSDSLGKHARGGCAAREKLR